MEPATRIPASTRLLMASLIAAVRTARFEDREYNGAASPRMIAAISNSLELAHRICTYAEMKRPEWFKVE